MCGEFNNISIFLWFKCLYDLILIYKWWLRSSDPCLRTNNIHMMASVSRRLIILCILCIKIKIMIQQKQVCPELLSGNICVFSVKLWLYFFTGIQGQSTSMTWYIFLDNSSVIFREFILACWSCCLKHCVRRKWRWNGHTLRKPKHNITRQALQWKPQGKRGRGRSINTWRRDFIAEMEIEGYRWQNLERMAQNRTRWRTVVCGLCTTKVQQA